MSLLSIVEDKLIQLLAPIFKPLAPLFTIFTKFKDNTIGILEAAQKLVADVENEYDQIKNFKSKPEWKNRVISVPSAIENIQNFVDVPSKVLGAIRDLVNQLRSKLQPAAFELDDLEGIEDLRSVLSKFGSKFAAGFEKLLGAIALIVDALVTIRSTIDDLQTIVDAVRTVREDLENLDGLFLTQQNPRKLEHLDSGKPIKIRIGHLHS